MSYLDIQFREGKFCVLRCFGTPWSARDWPKVIAACATYEAAEAALRLLTSST